MIAKDRLTESHNVMWRNFEPQTQTEARENNVQTLAQSDQGNNAETSYKFQLIRLVNGQQIQRNKPVRLRREGLGIHVIPKLIQCPRSFCTILLKSSARFELESTHSNQIAIL